jgi:hypothetical protein
MSNDLRGVTARSRRDGEPAGLQKTISTCLTGAASTRRQMIDKARTFGMHLLAAGTGIRKTPFTATFENPVNTRVELSLTPHTENG